MSRLHQEELVFFRLLSLLTLSPENKHDLLVDNSTREHVLFSSASKLLLLLQRDHEKLSKLCVIICTGNNVGMSSQGIWSFLPMTRWNMLGSVSFHQVKLQYWWTGWGVLSTASTPSGSSSSSSTSRSFDTLKCWRHWVDGWSGELGEVEWRREGRRRARHAAHFPSVMKVEQLITTECSLLSWPEKTRSVCVGAGSRKFTYSINVVPFRTQCAHTHAQLRVEVCRTNANVCGTVNLIICPHLQE